MRRGAGAGPPAPPPPRAEIVVRSHVPPPRRPAPAPWRRAERRPAGRPRARALALPPAGTAGRSALWRPPCRSTRRCREDEAGPRRYPSSWPARQPLPRWPTAPRRLSRARAARCRRGGEAPGPALGALPPFPHCRRTGLAGRARPAPSRRLMAAPAFRRLRSCAPARRPKAAGRSSERRCTARARRRTAPRRRCRDGTREDAGRRHGTRQDGSHPNGAALPAVLAGVRP